MMETSKGLITCDCENTLFGERFPKLFNATLFAYLIALKKSGYDVAIMSDSAISNEMRVGMANEANTGDINFLSYDDQMVITKDEMAGVEALAAFDDAHATHRVQAQYKFDPANEGVLSYMREQLEIFNATGFIDFDPSKLMEVQLETEAALRSEIAKNFTVTAQEQKAAVETKTPVTLLDRFVAAEALVGEQKQKAQSELMGEAALARTTTPEWIQIARATNKVRLADRSYDI